MILSKHIFLLMSFNKNACKRMSTVVGIKRVSHNILDLINEISLEYIERYISQCIILIGYTNKKTINVNDMRFLSRICSERFNIACSDLLFKKFNKYSSKQPFEELVRKIIADINPDIRLGKNVICLLQSQTEYYIIDMMKRARLFMQLDKRDTLLPRDIESVQLFKDTL